MISMARVGLGTAQFGARYGISNNVGQPDEAEVAAILSSAVETGIGYLDTAAGYGDAEVLIGRHLPSGHHLRIITKLPPAVGDAIGAGHTKAMLDTVAAALARMKINQLYGAIIHRVSDLAKPGWQYLVEALYEARARGWVARIGASVYDAAELALVESRFRPELIQLPFNALDRRLIASGWLDRLEALGTEVHARSVFLQGLLLMDPADIPSFFEPARGRIAELRVRWKTGSLTPLAGCLLFVFQRAGIGVATVGVNRASELAEIKAAIDRISDCNFAVGSIDAIDERYLDPRNWPATAH